jgi:Right handed beta helix region
VAVNYVTLVLDLYYGNGNPITQGTAFLTPTQLLTDAADQQYIPQAPVSTAFGAMGLPTVLLLAPDSTGPQPPGWAWALAFSGVPGSPPSFSIQPFAGPAAFTATNATPCVFTWTPVAAGLSSLPNGAGVKLSGSPPTGFTAGTMYYVVASSGTTFELSATSGGSPIASTSTGSGTLTVAQYNLSSLPVASPVASFSAYLPQPLGTALARQVPVATGVGEASAWGDVLIAVPPPSGDPSGVTDRVNVQDVLDTMAGQVIFSPGTYIFDTDILPSSGQTLLCYGAVFRRAADSGTAMNLMSIAGTSTSIITDVKVYGGTWDGNKANVTGVALEQYGENNGIRVAWAQNVSISDATVENCWGGGILSGDSVVSGLRINGCTARYNWDNGIFLRPGNFDATVDDCVAYGQHFHGIDAIRSNLVVFANCRAWGNGPTPTGEGAGFRLEGCYWTQIIGCSAWENGMIGGLALTNTTEGETGWTWTGAYSDSASYAHGDVVEWPPAISPAAALNEQMTWYCVTAPAAGTPPERGSAYWIPCAYDSLQGSPRPGYGTVIRDSRFTSNTILNTVNNWVSAGTYAVDDSVYYYNGSYWASYVCTNAVSGSTTPPDSDFGNWLASSFSSGIDCRDQLNIEISGCAISGNFSGIAINSGSGDGCDEVRIVECDIRDTNANGVSIGAQSAAKNFAITNCRFYGNYDAIAMSAEAYLKVSNCSFTGSSNNAIETSGSGNIRVDIYDNVFTGDVTQGRAWYEDGTNSTIRAGRNTISGQSIEPFHLSSPTSFVDGTNIIDATADHASGTASFSSSATSDVSFATPFAVAPVAAGITITPTGTPAGTWYVSSVSATGFTVTCSVSGSWPFSWQARNLPLQ